MSAFDWPTLQAAVAAALVQDSAPYTDLPSDFLTLFPIATSYAEGRIYREMVLLNTRAQDSSLLTTTGQRALPTLSTMVKPIIVTEGVQLVAAGVTYPFDMASLDAIDLIWPNQSQTLSPAAADSVGRYWAHLDDQTIVIAPTPDAAYAVQVTGLFAPPPISARNPTTYLATTYGDLLLTAVMVSLSGILTRNYGAQGDEARQAMSWEQQFQFLLGPAKAEERRRRGLQPDEQPRTPPPQEG